MMELSVWEQGEQIGTVTAQQEGLFYIFICKISKHAEQLRRIYVISKWRVEYLGIPYPRREGAELQACIPVSHFPDGLTAAAAAAMPRGAWLPWCGAIKRMEKMTIRNPERNRGTLTPAMVSGSSKRRSSSRNGCRRRRSRSLWAGRGWCSGSMRRDACPP